MAVLAASVEGSYGDFAKKLTPTYSILGSKRWDTEYGDFGLLANFGVGNYAPTLVLLSLMGMDPRLCFPIMASGASLMGAGSGIRHVQMGHINFRIVIGLTIGGIPAVFVAALLVKSMPLDLLRWLVFAVVLYAAATMGLAAARGRRLEKSEGPKAAAVAA